MSLSSTGAGNAGMLRFHLGTLPGAPSITQGSHLPGKRPKERYFFWFYYLLFILSVPYFAF